MLMSERIGLVRSITSDVNISVTFQFHVVSLAAKK